MPLQPRAILACVALRCRNPECRGQALVSSTASLGTEREKLVTLNSANNSETNLHPKYERPCPQHSQRLRASPRFQRSPPARRHQTRLSPIFWNQAPVPLRCDARFLRQAWFLPRCGLIRVRVRLKQIVAQ
jgi:hypothetical protein